MSQPVAGRLGAAAIFGAKVYFLAASMGLGFVLITKLDPEQFGRFFLVNDVVSLTGAVLIAGVIQSVSRHVAQDPHRVADVRRAGLRTLGAVGGAAALGMALLAVPMAHALGDPSLTPLFLAVAPIPLCYAVYATNIGVFNGLRRFGVQAGFDVGFITLKAALMIAAVVAGLGAGGALGGFTLATVVALAVSTPVSRSGRPGEAFPRRKLLAFSLVTIAFVFAVNAVLRVDTWLVKRGYDDASVGLYGVSLQVARIPYQLSVAIALVMFPFLAARETGRSELLTRDYVERALRYGLILAGIAAALLVGSGRELLFVLDPRKAAAADLLLVTGPAMLAYTMTFLATTVLVSLGRPGRAAGIAVVALVANAVLTWWWIRAPFIPLAPSQGVVDPGLMGAAHAVLAANLLGVVLAMWMLRRETGFALSWRFAVGLGIIGVVLLAGRAWQPELEGTGRLAVAGWVLIKLTVLGLLASSACVVFSVAPLAEVRALLGRAPAEE